MVWGWCCEFSPDPSTAACSLAPPLLLPPGLIAAWARAEEGAGVGRTWDPQCTEGSQWCPPYWAQEQVTASAFCGPLHIKWIGLLMSGPSEDPLPSVCLVLGQLAFE